MKIECLKDKLSQSLNLAEKVTSKNLSLPVLSCFLLEASKNNLRVVATNLDLGVEINIPAKISKDGVVAVPAHTLSALISSLSEKNVTIELVDNNIEVSTDKTSTKIKTMNHEEFPSLPGVSGQQGLKISPKDLVNGLRAVWYGAAVSSIKPELASVFIHSDEDGLVFAATDSFRLAEKKVRVKGVKDFGNILIPFKNVSDIIKLLENTTDELLIIADKNQIGFHNDSTYITSRIIDGTFPDYKQIIPKEFKTDIIVLKQDLLNSLRTANIFSDKFNQVHIEAKPAQKTFTIQTKNNDVGENTNNVEAVVSGDAVDINFNHKYIIDCFQSIDADSVSLGFNGAGRPMVIRGVSDKSFLYLVMPMNR